MLLGGVFGIIGSLFGRAVRDFPLIGPALVVALGYLSFLTAEIFEFSGIITSLTAGMVMQHYLLKAMKHDARIGLETILKVDDEDEGFALGSEGTGALWVEEDHNLTPLMLPHSVRQPRREI